MLELMEITKDTRSVPGLEMFVRDEAGEPRVFWRWLHLHFIDKLYDQDRFASPAELAPAGSDRSSAS